VNRSVDVAAGLYGLFNMKSQLQGLKHVGATYSIKNGAISCTWAQLSVSMWHGDIFFLYKLCPRQRLHGVSSHFTILWRTDTNEYIFLFQEPPKEMDRSLYHLSSLDKGT